MGGNLSVRPRKSAGYAKTTGEPVAGQAKEQTRLTVSDPAFDPPRNSVLRGIPGSARAMRVKRGHTSLLRFDAADAGKVAGSGGVGKGFDAAGGWGEGAMRSPGT